MDSSELRTELQKLKDKWSAAGESHNNRYRPRNKERFKNGTYHNSNIWQPFSPKRRLFGLTTTAMPMRWLKPLSDW